MLNEEILKQVMASVLNIDIESINEDASMDTIEKWDSLHHMNLVLALEEEFKITIPDEDAGNITSYQLIKLVLNDLLKQNS
jgi:acyl carrier protein